MAAQQGAKDKLKQYLEKKGVEVFRGQGEASMRAEIKDPDGLSIELVQRE